MNISLYYTDGSSDKVYHAQLVEEKAGYVVNFQYGRRGSTLQTGTKTAVALPLDKAQKVFDKLVSEKKGKGYTEGADGTPYQGGEKAGRVSGLVPQLLNPIDEAEVLAYLRRGPMNDEQRRVWVLNDEGLYRAMRESGRSVKGFVRTKRRFIDEVAGNIADGRKPAHYLVYGKNSKE